MFNNWIPTVVFPCTGYIKRSNLNLSKHFFCSEWSTFLTRMGTVKSTLRSSSPASVSLASEATKSQNSDSPLSKDLNNGRLFLPVRYAYVRLGENSKLERIIQWLNYLLRLFESKFIRYLVCYSSANQISRSVSLWSQIISRSFDF